MVICEVETEGARIPFAVQGYLDRLFRDGSQGKWDTRSPQA